MKRPNHRFNPIIYLPVAKTEAALSGALSIG
jgi:hypothetical protein